MATDNRTEAMSPQHPNCIECGIPAQECDELYLEWDDFCCERCNHPDPEIHHYG